MGKSGKHDLTRGESVMSPKPQGFQCFFRFVRLANASVEG